MPRRPCPSTFATRWRRRPPSAKQQRPVHEGATAVRPPMSPGFEGRPMSALARSPEEQRTLLPMTVSTLDQVLAIEQEAYAFPWTRGNFIDSLHAGYAAWRLQAAPGLLLGYFVAMQGVDDTHP